MPRLLGLLFLIPFIENCTPFFCGHNYLSGAVLTEPTPHGPHTLFPQPFVAFYNRTVRIPRSELFIVPCVGVTRLAFVRVGIVFERRKGVEGVLFTA